MLKKIALLSFVVAISACTKVETTPTGEVVKKEPKYPTTEFRTVCVDGYLYNIVEEKFILPKPRKNDSKVTERCAY